MQAFIKSKDGFETLRRNALSEGTEGLLETVWENGKLLRNQTLAEVRELSDSR